MANNFEAIDRSRVGWQRGIGDAALGVVMCFTAAAYATDSPLELMNLATAALAVRAIAHGLLNEETGKCIGEVRVLAAADAASAVVALLDVIFAWGGKEAMMEWGIWRNVAVTMANGGDGVFGVDKKLAEMGILEEWD